MNECAVQNKQEIREGLGIDNRMVGYVFLVDGKGRARWRYVVRWTWLMYLGSGLCSDLYVYHRGTGRPSEEEIGAMLRCAHELREESTDAARGAKRYGKFKAK